MAMQALIEPTDAETNARFGFDVSVSGTAAIVGAFGKDGGNKGTGAAYIFRFGAGGAKLTQEVELPAKGLKAGDYLGRAVAIAGGMAVACAPRAAKGVGKCFVFREEQPTRGKPLRTHWTLEATLVPPRGACRPACPSFGLSVAVDTPDAVVVGATGAAFVFVRAHSGGWSAATRLLVGGTPVGGGASFGRSVAIASDAGGTGTIAVGAPGTAVFVFVSAANKRSTWTQVARLVPRGKRSAQYGCAVSLSEGAALLAVGAYDENSDAGATYIFASPLSSSVAARVEAADKSAGDRFGFDVAASAGRVLVGAYGAGASTQFNGGKGASYLFSGAADGIAGGKSWQQESKMFAVDGSVNDRFGYAVAMSGENVIVGARGDDNHGKNSGSAYALILPKNMGGSGPAPPPPPWLSPTCQTCGKMSEFYVCCKS